jgi:hypothetical protein
MWASGHRIGLLPEAVRSSLDVRASRQVEIYAEHVSQWRFVFGVVLIRLFAANRNRCAGGLYLAPRFSM